MTIDTNNAGRWDFTVEEGATFTRTITVSSFDLTGFTIRFTIKKRPDKAALLYVSTADNITIDDAASGTFTITVPSSTTDALAWTGDAFATVELESGAGVVTRLLEGRVQLARRINGS